jgi:uncharacterized BrkB/YihY/UPF0761 family membrane protein
MPKEHLLNIKLVCLYAAVLFPMTAYASFNGVLCRDFVCNFVVIGVLFGVFGGIPISIVIFIGLHLIFCNRERSKVNQALLGGLNGIIAFEISSVSAALIATWGKTTAGYHENYPLIGFVSVYLLFVIISLLYAHSNPRPRHGKA